MLSRSDFDSKAVTQAEELYTRTQLTPEQRKMLEPLAQEMAKHVPISELAIRGFSMMAAGDWQKKHSHTVASMAQGNPQQRVQVVRELCEELAIKLKQVLHFKGKEKEGLVDDGVKRMIDVYTKAYAKR